MKYAFAITDRDWYNYQKDHGFNNFINFWTPTVWKNTKLKPGHILVFKLKEFKNSIEDIGGYGTIVEYKSQTREAAWNEFGRRNGFDTKEEFLKKLTKANRGRSKDSGCFVLKDVVFFDEPVKLSDYGLSVSPRLERYSWGEGPFPFAQQVTSTQLDFSLVDPAKKEKVTQSTTKRVGQDQFHADISRVYGYRCCITGETAPELLQAAHIQDYICKESHHIQNGLLLRIDIHKLFDSGLLYIDQHYHVHISPLVSTTEYKNLENKPISLPNNPSDYPSLAALQFKENSFRE